LPLRLRSAGVTGIDKSMHSTFGMKAFGGLDTTYVEEGMPGDAATKDDMDYEIRDFRVVTPPPKGWRRARSAILPLVCVPLPLAAIVLFAGLGQPSMDLDHPLAYLGFALAGALTMLVYLAAGAVGEDRLAPLVIVVFADWIAMYFFGLTGDPKHSLAQLLLMVGSAILMMPLYDAVQARRPARANNPADMARLARILFTDAVDAGASELIAEPRPSDKNPDQPELSIKFIIRDEPRYHTPVPIFYHPLFMEVHKRMARLAPEEQRGKAYAVLRSAPRRLHFEFYPTRYGEAMRALISPPAPPRD
jgi:hypothetical protein